MISRCHALFLALLALASAALAAERMGGFVGAAACAGCHAAETQAWRGSQHDQAMQEATSTTVLGDFADVSVTHYGVTSRFYRKGDGFFVTTEGPDGAMQEYKIDYTFGVYPLQQYLVAFPGGRWQALSLAWDTRPKEVGGQRWFHLYPDEKIAHDDELHWTGINQNWNWMCADCHSTNLVRGYDLNTDSYQSTFSALNVSCEACHGPGLAMSPGRRQGPTPANPPRACRCSCTTAATANGSSQRVPGSRSRMTPMAKRTETEVCAPCHARRSPLGDGHEVGKPLLDGYRPSLLDPRLYHADGQIDGEVFIHGSFLQSRMYAAGVTCSDCHEPHGLQLRAEGNAVCSQCHLPAAFDVAEHHHHAPGQPGSQCVDCHMPAKTYMVVDPRRDHGFKIPRPDLATRTGAPDACTGCHEAKDSVWAAVRIAEWYGSDRRREASFGEVLAADRLGQPGAGARLAKIAGDPGMPAIVRATALAGLERRLDRPAFAAVQRGLADPDPMVRLAAVGALGEADPRLRAELALPLLTDPVTAVRLETARILAPVPTGDLAPDQRAALDAAFAAYESAQGKLVDRPEGLITLANFYRERGRLVEAEARLADSIRLHPAFVPAYANLADLMRQQGRDAEGGRVLEQGMAMAPASAELTHAKGLLLIRQQKYPEAVAALAKAVDLAPDNPRYAYVYAVALQETGRPGDAVAVLQGAVRQHPADPDLLFTLALALLQQGDLDGARRYAQALGRIAPTYPNAQELLRAVSPGG